MFIEAHRVQREISPVWAMYYFTEDSTQTHSPEDEPGNIEINLSHVLRVTYCGKTVVIDYTDGSNDTVDIQDETLPFPDCIRVKN